MRTGSDSLINWTLSSRISKSSRLNTDTLNLRLENFSKNNGSVYSTVHLGQCGINLGTQYAFICCMFNILSLSIRLVFETNMSCWRVGKLVRETRHSHQCLLKLNGSNRPFFFVLAHKSYVVYLPFERISLIRRRYHCLRRTSKFRPVLACLDKKIYVLERRSYRYPCEVKKKSTQTWPTVGLVLTEVVPLTIVPSYTNA